MEFRDFIARSGSVLDLLADYHLAVYAAAEDGEILVAICRTEPLGVVGLVRVAVAQLNQEPLHEWFWTAVDLPDQTPVRLFFVRVDADGLLGVVAQGPGEPLDRDTGNPGDLKVAQAIFRNVLQLFNEPLWEAKAPPIPSGGSSSAGGGAEGFAGIAGLRSVTPRNGD